MKEYNGIKTEILKLETTKVKVIISTSAIIPNIARAFKLKKNKAIQIIKSLLLKKDIALLAILICRSEQSIAKTVKGVLQDLIIIVPMLEIA